MTSVIQSLIELSKRRRKRELWQQYLKQRSSNRPFWFSPNSRRGQHGNFHFHNDGLIELRKQGRLLLALYDLDLLYYLFAIKAVDEEKREDYYWRLFNDLVQKMICYALAELESLKEASENE